MQNFVYQLHQHALESGTWNVDVLLPGRQSKYKMTCDKYCMMMINPDAMICYVKSSCFGWSHLSKRWFCWHEENFVNRFFQKWHHPTMNFYGGEIFEVTQIDCSLCLGVSKNRGTPKWMVKIMEKPYENGWFGGTTIFGNPYTFTVYTLHKWNSNVFCWKVLIVTSTWR